MTNKPCPICNGSGEVPESKSNFIRAQYKIMFNSGRASALREAVDRIQAMIDSKRFDGYGAVRIAFDNIIAALRALEAK